MIIRPLPPLDRLQSLLRYEPETGRLFWRDDLAPWGRMKPGAEAGYASKGWRSCKMDGRIFPVHRIIWKLHYGREPDGIIDHINGDPTDNRIANLRCGDHTVNSRNTKRNSNNRSGITGVYQRPDGRWTANICVNYRSRHIGTFSTREAAAEARAKASAENGFHPNHGRTRKPSFDEIRDTYEEREPH